MKSDCLDAFILDLSTNFTSTYADSIAVYKLKVKGLLPVDAIFPCIGIYHGDPTYETPSMKELYMTIPITLEVFVNTTANTDDITLIDHISDDLILHLCKNPLTGSDIEVQIPKGESTASVMDNGEGTLQVLGAEIDMIVKQSMRL